MNNKRREHQADANAAARAKEINRLRTKNKNLRMDVKLWRNRTMEAAKAVEDFETLQAEVEKLREALEKYGRHLGCCAGSYEFEGHKKPCHCGYEQALSKEA